MQYVPRAALACSVPHPTNPAFTNEADKPVWTIYTPLRSPLFMFMIFVLFYRLYISGYHIAT